MAYLHIKERFKSSDGGVENTKPSDTSIVVQGLQRSPVSSVEGSFLRL